MGLGTLVAILFIRICVPFTTRSPQESGPQTRLSPPVPMARPGVPQLPHDDPVITAVIPG